MLGNQAIPGLKSPKGLNRRRDHAAPAPFYRAFFLIATLAPLGPISPAFAQQDVPETPVTAPLGQRFILMVLDQPDRDLSHGSSKINMMYDTKTGRSWVLQYTVKPGSNEQGYVWSEVPYAAPPK